MTKTVKLGEIATFINGYPFKPTDWKKEGLPIIRIQDLTGNAYETNYFNGTIPVKYYVRNGDVLISWSASLGIYEWQRGDAVLNQHIFKVVFDKIDVDKQYFKHIVSHKLDEMVALTHGATMKHITKGDFDNLPISLPSLPEQRRIAALLDHADALRQKDRQLLAHYDQLAQSLFLELFGDPVRNEKGWEVKNLGNLLAKVQIGPFGSLLHVEDYISGGIPLINPTHIADKKIIADFNFSVSQQKHKSLSNYHLRQGDVIMGRRGEMGRCALVTDKEAGWLCGTGSLFLRPEKNTNATFLTHLISSPQCKKALENDAKGQTMLNLNQTVISNFRVPAPPLPLQTHFAQAIEQIERQKAVVRQQMAASEGLFGRLLQESFGG